MIVQKDLKNNVRNSEITGDCVYAYVLCVCMCVQKRERERKKEKACVCGGGASFGMYHVRSCRKLKLQKFSNEESRKEINVQNMNTLERRTVRKIFQIYLNEGNYWRIKTNQELNELTAGEANYGAPMPKKK